MNATSTFCFWCVSASRYRECYIQITLKVCQLLEIMNRTSILSLQVAFGVCQLLDIAKSTSKASFRASCLQQQRTYPSTILQKRACEKTKIFSHVLFINFMRRSSAQRNSDFRRMLAYGRSFARYSKSRSEPTALTFFSILMRLPAIVIRDTL